MRRLPIALLLGCTMVAGCVAETDRSLEDHSGDSAATGAAEPAPGTTAAEPTPVTAVTVALADSVLTAAQATVAAGTVSFQIRNRGTTPHALLLRGPQEEWDSGPVAPGDSLTMSIALAAGTYELHCPLDNGAHRQRGERASLTVR